MMRWTTTRCVLVDLVWSSLKWHTFQWPVRHTLVKLALTLMRRYQGWRRLRTSLRIVGQCRFCNCRLVAVLHKRQRYCMMTSLALLMYQVTNRGWPRRVRWQMRKFVKASPTLVKQPVVRLQLALPVLSYTVPTCMRCNNSSQSKPTNALMNGVVIWTTACVTV